MIHTAHDGWGWEIWSDTDGARFDGRCIGVGRTLDEAKLDAISELNGDIAAIEGLAEEDPDGHRDDDDDDLDDDEDPVETSEELEKENDEDDS